MVRSPIVGTYYESPSPGSPPFVKPGDKVEAGQILCIVEAMKLMNEIESDAAGELVKILVSNGQPIEYGQELFAISAVGRSAVSQRTSSLAYRDRFVSGHRPRSLGAGT